MKRCASLMKNGSNIYDYDYDDEVIQIKKMDLKVRTIANATKKRHFQSGKNKYVLLML